MREILFKGKRVDNGEWVEGNIAFGEKQESWASIFDKNLADEGAFIEIAVDPDTVVQFTGLCDKNGKKIFEGDIVKYTRTNMYAPSTNFHNQDLVSIHKVYWNEEKCCFYQDHYTEERCIGAGSINFDDERAENNIIEVIGNIYDNPELLEGL